MLCTTQGRRGGRKVSNGGVKLNLGQGRKGEISVFIFAFVSHHPNLSELAISEISFPQVQSGLLLIVIDESFSKHTSFFHFVLSPCPVGGGGVRGWLRGVAGSQPRSTHHRETILLRKHFFFFFYSEGGLTPKQVAQRGCGLHPWKY